MLVQSVDVVGIGGTILAVSGHSGAMLGQSVDVVSTCIVGGG